MNKPNALIKLLADLEAEAAGTGTSVVTVKNSYALLGLPGEPDSLKLSAEECELLFDTQESALRFYEALDEPADAALELHNISLDDEVLEALNGLFSVDES